MCIIVFIRINANIFFNVNSIYVCLTAFLFINEHEFYDKKYFILKNNNHLNYKFDGWFEIISRIYLI